MGPKHAEGSFASWNNHAQAAHDSVIEKQSRRIKARFTGHILDDYGLITLERVACLRVRPHIYRGRTDKSLFPSNAGAQQKVLAIRLCFEDLAKFHIEGAGHRRAHFLIDIPE